MSWPCATNSTNSILDRGPLGEPRESLLPALQAVLVYGFKFRQRESSTCQKRLGSWPFSSFDRKILIAVDIGIIDVFECLPRGQLATGPKTRLQTSERLRRRLQKHRLQPFMLRTHGDPTRTVNSVDVYRAGASIWLRNGYTDRYRDLHGVWVGLMSVCIC